MTGGVQAPAAYYIDAQSIDIDILCGHRIVKPFNKGRYGEETLRPRALFARLEELDEAARDDSHRGVEETGISDTA